ncbi:transcriptional repressor LexA [Nocardia halotolerans]|uniref:LexA repressor n=1 Tax=Nocardia halotolerans TaxID=1755878 RepID=A0ABV8V988_9NOCA
MTAYDDLDYLDTANLPPRRQHILAVIRDSVLAHGYPPSAREIADAVGLRSTSTVSKHLRALEDDGFLRRSASMTRPIDVRMFLRGASGPDSDSAVTVPVVGDIAAGAPITADQHTDDVLTLPRELVGRGEVFGLRVRGDSMIDAAICDGDLVVVRSQREANSGDIVAAMIGDEATVKVYRRRNGHIRLEPCNPAYSVIDGDEATVIGKVVSVMRRL